MRTTRLITAPLAAALIATAVPVPAAAVPADTQRPPGDSDAPKLAIHGSRHSEPPTANVYVPPADLGPETTPPTANVYVPPADLGPETTPPTANVYVPPADLGPETTPPAHPPTGPANAQPITRPPAVVAAPASGFDWGSAGVGAAAVLGACAITLAAILGVRRRTVRPRSLTTR
jgi:hypothetical protein